MIEGARYIELVNSYFCFLDDEFHFKLFETHINGNVFYSIRYRNPDEVVSISYENIEDYFLVIVYLLQNGELPNYDDKTKTLHLDKLNERIIPYVGVDEIKLNNEHFSKFRARSDFERKVLKAAKELRLCLRQFPRWSKRTA